MFGVGLAMGCILAAAICGIYAAVYDNAPLLLEWWRGRKR
jgi:hypothetical protein